MAIITRVLVWEETRQLSTECRNEEKKIGELLNHQQHYNSRKLPIKQNLMLINYSTAKQTLPQPLIYDLNFKIDNCLNENPVVLFVHGPHPRVT